MIVSAIVGLLAVGAWALWWDDVRSLLNLGPGEGRSIEQVQTPAGQT
jgi:hypothetical protein